MGKPVADRLDLFVGAISLVRKLAGYSSEPVSRGVFPCFLPPIRCDFVFAGVSIESVVGNFEVCFFFFRLRSIAAVNNAPSKKPMVVVEIKSNESGRDCFQKRS